MADHCSPIQPPLMLIHPRQPCKQPLIALLFSGLLGGRCLLIKGLRRCGVEESALTARKTFHSALGNNIGAFFFFNVVINSVPSGAQAPPTQPQESNERSVFNSLQNV